MCIQLTLFRTTALVPPHRSIPGSRCRQRQHFSSSHANASFSFLISTHLLCRSNNIEVLSYSRLTSGQSVEDCMAKCRVNQECYSFNYNKLTKWCYLGTTEETDVRTVRNPKFAVGFRRCVDHINNNAWNNDEFSGGNPTAAPGPVTGLTVADSTASTNTLDVVFVAPTTFGTNDDGSASTLASYRVTCTSANGLVVATVGFSGVSGTVGGLANGAYTCSVVVVNSAALESTAVVSASATVA